MTILNIPPITKDLQNGHYINSDVELDTESRQVECHVRLTCTNKIAGFTGGVQLFYFNENHQRIGQSQIQQYGLDQAPIFGRTIGLSSSLIMRLWVPRPSC
jgi:hypothetical protein